MDGESVTQEILEGYALDQAAFGSIRRTNSSTFSEGRSGVLRAATRRVTRELGRYSSPTGPRCPRTP